MKVELEHRRECKADRVSNWLRWEGHLLRGTIETPHGIVGVIAVKASSWFTVNFEVILDGYKYTWWRRFRGDPNTAPSCYALTRQAAKWVRELVAE